VVLEPRHGLLVEALVDAGFTVLPVNPDLVARRRGPAKKKDDAEDARICCLLALDQYAQLRKLIPHGELGAELRAIARDDDRAARDERRLGNRLRADLLAVFPAAIDIADGDLSAAVFLHLIERWPSHDELAAAGRDAIQALARANRHGWPDRFTDRVLDALAQPGCQCAPSWARAKTGSCRHAGWECRTVRARGWFAMLQHGAAGFDVVELRHDHEPGRQRLARIVQLPRQRQGRVLRIVGAMRRTRVAGGTNRGSVRRDPVVGGDADGHSGGDREQVYEQ
jgi:hypothetical protein